MSNIRKPKTGDRFTRLLVLNTFLLKEKNGLKRTTRVVCLCDCGREKVVRAASLKKGETKSCGCLAKNSVGGVSSHKHPLYKTWKNMRSRCNNPNLPEYKDYGGRGLKVTQRWDDFPRFVKDMGPKPTPSHTLTASGTMGTIPRRTVNGRHGGIKPTTGGAMSSLPTMV